MAADADPLLVYPDGRQIRDNIIILKPGVELQKIVGARSQCAVSVDGSFGRCPGSSGSVNDGAWVIRFAGFHILLKEPGVFGFISFALCQRFPVSDQNIIIVVSKPLVVPVNDFFKKGKGIFDFEQLINLLLAFNNGNSCLTILGDVFYFRW